MGNLMVLPSCFHPERRAQAVMQGEVENQKLTRFLPSQHIIELCAEGFGQGITRETQLRVAVRFVVLQPHGHFISVMKSRLDFTCSSAVRLQPPSSPARRG